MKTYICTHESKGEFTCFAPAEHVAKWLAASYWKLRWTHAISATVSEAVA